MTLCMCNIWSAHFPQETCKATLLPTIMAYLPAPNGGHFFAKQTPTRY